jgi:hypothetical protein
VLALRSSGDAKNRRTGAHQLEGHAGLIASAPLKLAALVAGTHPSIYRAPVSWPMHQSYEVNIGSRLEPDHQLLCVYQLRGVDRRRSNYRLNESPIR